MELRFKTPQSMYECISVQGYEIKDLVIEWRLIFYITPEYLEKQSLIIDRVSGEVNGHPIKGHEIKNELIPTAIGIKDVLIDSEDCKIWVS